ncbi:MAG: cytidine deaminase [Ilumatobacteraceae bacterium]
MAADPSAPAHPATIDTATDTIEAGTMLEVAAAARDRAYAPYSGFRIGAAVSTTSGEVVAGALVESVSLGLAMCAERVALFNVVSRGLIPNALAIVSPRTDGELTFPCGACLQVALELVGPDCPVVASDPAGNSAHSTVGALLTRAPHRHTYADLVAEATSPG